MPIQTFMCKFLCGRVFWFLLIISLQVELLCCVGLPRWFSGQEPACQCRRHRSLRFDPCMGKMPWRRKRQPTPVFLPGESHEQRNLEGYSPYGPSELDPAEHRAQGYTSGTSVFNCGNTGPFSEVTAPFTFPPPPQPQCTEALISPHAQQHWHSFIILCSFVRLGAMPPHFLI